MTELFNQMLDKAKKDKNVLIKLKEMAVAAQQFELAASLRELEKELFPLTEEEKQAKEEAEKVRTALAMASVKTDVGTSWLVYQTIKAYLKKKGKFSLKEATELTAMRHRLFPIYDTES